MQHHSRFPLRIIQKRISRRSTADEIKLAFLKRLPTQPHIQNSQRKMRLANYDSLYPLWCFFFPCFPVQPCWRDTCESPHLFLLGTRTYTGEIVSQSDVHSCTLWLLVSYPTLLKMVFRFTPTCRNDMIIQHAAGKKLRHLNTLLELCLIMKCRITLHYNLCVAHPPTKVTQ